MKYADVPGPSLLSSQTQQSSAKESASTSASKPTQGPPVPKPNYDPFSSLTSSHPSSRSATPSLVKSQQSTKLPPPPSDPFAALSNPAPRQTSQLLSTQNPQQPAPSPSASLFDFASPKPTPPTTQIRTSSHQASNGAPADDDWNFASALPDDTFNLPSANNLIISNTAVKIAFQVSRPNVSESSISIQASFSNSSPTIITEYTFQVAVAKVAFPRFMRQDLTDHLVSQKFVLKMTPQSGRTLQPHQQNGITQPIAINGVSKGHADSLKIRWKASYKVAGDLRQEQGEVPSLGIA